MIFFIFHFILNSNPALGAEFNCAKETPTDCHILSSRAQSEQNNEEAYRFSKAGCDFNEHESCQQLYLEAEMLGPKKVAEAKADLIKKCAEDEQFCEDVANIYYDEKKTTEALEIDRKYFAKYHIGAFPWRTYKAGNKAEGFSTALSACNRESSQCDFFILHMPDHPQMGELLTQSEKLCRLGTDEVGGGTSCAVVGTYYYKNQNHAKAIEIWNVQCSKNISTPCQLILGSDADTTTKLAAFKNFCTANRGEVIEANAQALRKQSCSGDLLSIPPKMIKESQLILDQFLKNQESKTPTS